MVGVALWAWVAAPSTARFFVRVGNPPGFDGTVSKGTGLVMWIGLGAVAFLGSFFAEGDIEGLAIAGAGLLVFLLLMQIVSVRRMMR
jgi:hypothetical protein